MGKIQNWLSRNKIKAHLLAFMLILLPPIPLYFAAQAHALPLTWGLLALVVLGNVLAVSTK